LDELKTAAFEHRTVDVRRCDDQGCTPVSTTAEVTGIFVNLSAPNAGYLLKIAWFDEDILFHIKAGEFVEVATQALDAYLGFGACPVRIR
jgi:hypothetical protein